MSATFQKVTKGQPFSSITAQDYNRSMEAAKRVLTGTRKDGTGGRRGVENRSIAYIVPPERYRRLNNRSIVQLDEPTILPEDDLSGFLNPLVWKTKEPTPRKSHGEHKLPVTLAVTLKGMDSPGRERQPQVVPALISGLVQVRVNVTEIDHDHADATDEGYVNGGEAATQRLDSQYSGPAQIVWREKPEETGEMWAVVNLDNTYTPRRQIVLFRLSEDLTTEDEFGRAEIYENGVGYGVQWRNDERGSLDERDKKCHVRNLRREPASGERFAPFVFEGGENNYGIGYHSYGPSLEPNAPDDPAHGPGSKFATFQIIQMQCT